MLHATGMALRARLRRRHERAPSRFLFCRPGFRAAERCSSGAQSQAAFELQCRLKPGPGHFQQDLPVPLRFGVAGPTHALLRELAEFFGGCGHGALYAGTGGSATGLSATGACVRAAGDEGQDITLETVAIAVSRCQAPGRSEKSARVLILLRLFFRPLQKPERFCNPIFPATRGRLSPRSCTPHSLCISAATSLRVRYAGSR
jgi:hypothetical protein